MGTVSEAKENLIVKEGENTKIVRMSVPISLEAEDTCTLEIGLYSGELRIDYIQTQLKIRRTTKPLLEVKIDILTEDNLPVPDVVSYISELQIVPTVISHSETDERIQLIVFASFYPGKMYKIEYKPFVISKNKTVVLKGIKLLPEIKSQLTKVKISGAVYQKGIRIKSVKIHDKVFFITSNM